MSRGAPWLLLLALGCAHGPYTIWYGSTPDRTHRLEIVEDATGQAVVVDGLVAPHFDAVAPSSLVQSNDGRHLAYAARVGGKWHVARDHVLGGAWDGIADIVLSPDATRLAYVAEEGGRWRVVVDGVAGAPVPSVFGETLRFSPDGRRVAYVAGDARSGARVVVDDIAGERVDAVASIGFDERGRVVYAARRGDAAFVMVEQTPGSVYSSVGEVAFGARGAFAHSAVRGGAWYVVANGVEHAVSGPVSGLAPSPDGSRLAWIARSAAGSFAVVNGKASAAFDDLGRAVWSPDGERFAYAGRRGRVGVLTVNGREQAYLGLVSDPAWSPVGNPLAFVFQPATRAHDGGARVVVGDRAYVVDFVVGQTLVWSSDGRHWACLVGRRRDRRLYFLVDGRPGPSLDLRELVSHAATLAARGSSPQRDGGAEVLRTLSQRVADAAARRKHRP